MVFFLVGLSAVHLQVSSSHCKDTGWSCIESDGKGRS